MIVDDSSLVGLPVLVVGRQVATKFGGYVDVLAVDAVDLQRLIQVIRDWQLVTEDVSPDVEDGSDLAGDTAESQRTTSGTPPGPPSLRPSTTCMLSRPS